MNVIVTTLKSLIIGWSLTVETLMVCLVSFSSLPNGGDLSELPKFSELDSVFEMLLTEIA